MKNSDLILNEKLKYNKIRNSVQSIKTELTTISRQAPNYFEGATKDAIISSVNKIAIKCITLNDKLLSIQVKLAELNDKALVEEKKKI